MTAGSTEGKAEQKEAGRRGGKDEKAEKIAHKIHPVPDKRVV